MREIKFRAYIKDESKICEESKPVFSLCEFKTNLWDVSNICFDVNLISINIENANFYFPISAVEILQYTGLKDKNGVEIYEGDIVKETHEHITSDGIGVVKFNNGSFYIDNCFKTCLWNEDSIFEVLGNIHQNPELIKEGEINEAVGFGTCGKERNKRKRRCSCITGHYKI